MISHTVMMQIIDRVSIIVACIVFKEIAKQFKLSDRSNLFSNILLTSVIVILMIIDILNGNYGVLFKPYYLIGMLAIYCKIIYDINWFENIMYTIAYVYSYKILDYALYWVVFKFTPKYDATIIQIKSLVLMIIILIIILKCIKKIKIIDSYKLHYIFIVIAITGNIITTIFTFMVEKSIFYSEDIFLNVSGAVLNNMLPLIMTVSSSVLILVVKKIIEDADLKAENKIVKEKMDMQYKYYLGIQESQNKVKRLYHDMNNHIFCIKNMYESNNSVDEYVNNINENIEDYKNIFDTKNMILDIILNEKKYLCNENNIELFCDINFNKCDFIDMIDVCSIFSNILDNAIEACEKINDINIHKSIRLRGTIVRKYFVVKCENTKINKVIIKNNKLITTKKNKEFHGIGLESVKKSLEKYDGELQFKDLENEFIVKLYIPLQENMTVRDVRVPVGSSVL